MLELTTLDKSHFAQLPKQAECKYEVLNSSIGLTAMCGYASFPSRCEWTHDEGGGLLCGLILQGTIAMEVGDCETSYLKENESFFWAERKSVRMRHIIPSAQTLSTIFVNIPEKLAHNYDFPKHLFETSKPPKEHHNGIANFYKSPLSEKALSTAQEIATCNYDGPFRAFFLQAKYLELLVEFRKQFADNDNAVPSITDKRILFAERLLKARAILIDEFQSPPSLGDLAERVAMCKSALTAGFRNSFDQSVTEFIQERRLIYALNQLKHNRMTVSQAAYSVGYSRAYFSTLFRRRFGISPRDMFKHSVGERVN